MPDKKYSMVESVGKAHETIHEYDDVEKHHPTWKESSKRQYKEIDAKREEVTLSPSGELMISKDIVFKVDGINGSSKVNVPSPFKGYAKLNERWGTVDIYEQPNGKGLLIGRVRHMDPIIVKENQEVVYGQPLGMQGGKNPGKKPFGPHAHIDVSLSHLDEFKQFIKDVDSGLITTDNYPSKAKLSQSGIDKSDWSDTNTPVKIYNEDGTSINIIRNASGSIEAMQNLDANGAEIGPKSVPGLNQPAIVQPGLQQQRMSA